MWEERLSEVQRRHLEELRNSPIGRGVIGRAEVAELAAKDPGRALLVARSIDHPWYRCQALTSVVEANPSAPAAEGLLLEALAVAATQDEPNRVACLASWPLRLLVATGSTKATEHTLRLLEVIATEPHGLRRLDGLRGILVAVASSDPLRALVLERLTLAAAASHGWRTERIIDVIAVILMPFDREAASRLLSLHPPRRYTKRSRAML